MLDLNGAPAVQSAPMSGQVIDLHHERMLRRPFGGYGTQTLRELLQMHKRNGNAQLVRECAAEINRRNLRTGIAAAVLVLAGTMQGCTFWQGFAQMSDHWCDAHPHAPHARCWAHPESQ